MLAEAAGGPALARQMTKAEYEACQTRDEAAFRAAVDNMTLRALRDGLARVDYAAAVSDEWRKSGFDDIIDKRVDIAVAEVVGETSLWERVLDARLLSDAEVLAAVANRCKLPLADLGVASEAGRDALPEPLARRYGVVPLAVTDALFEVATSNPFDVGAEQSLAFATGREIRMMLASPPRIREKLDQLYGQARREG